MNQDKIVDRQEQIATSNKRMGAFIIDDIVVASLFIAIFWEQMSSLDNPLDLVEIDLFLLEKFIYFVLIKILYHTFLVWQNGMTLGKYLMKIKVLSIQTGQIPQLHGALLRATLRVVSEVLFYIGFIMAFFNPLVQTFHDKLSGCVVVDA